MTGVPVEIPKHIIEAAVNAAVEARRSHPANEMLRDPAFDRFWEKIRLRTREDLKAGLAAVLPLIETHVQEQVASEAWERAYEVACGAARDGDTR